MALDGTQTRLFTAGTDGEVKVGGQPHTHTYTHTKSTMKVLVCPRTDTNKYNQEKIEQCEEFRRISFLMESIYGIDKIKPN